MQIHTLSTGRPQVMARLGRQLSTSINRRAQAGEVELTEAGLAGDRVSDQRVHGGPDKALCVYPWEHYAHFAARLGRSLEPPAFGENITSEGLLDAEVCVGDRFRVGAAVLEVSQPRQPCLKLALKHAEPRLIRWINESRRSGWYLRVIEPAPLCAGMPFELLERPHAGFTIAELTAARTGTPPDTAFLRALLALSRVAEGYREQIGRRLRGEEEFGE